MHLTWPRRFRIRLPSTIAIALAGFLPCVPCSAALVNHTAESINLPGITSYLLYRPTGYSDNNATWPLIIFLHGASLRGTDLDPLARHGVALEIERGRPLPGIVVSPLLDSVYSWWDAATMRIFIQQIVARYRVDPERIYVTGLSLGGYGSWDIGTTCPDLIAAIAPICGAGNVSQASVLRDTPVWAFHGALDPTVPLIQSQVMISAIAQAGGFPRLTVYPFAAHNSWSATYASSAFYDWLFAQTRSTATNTILGPTVPPKPVAIAVNQSATFTAQITPAATAFRWQRLPAVSPLWCDLHEGGAYSGTATATLTVSAVVPAMSGDRFRCLVTDTAGTLLTTASATLTVRVPSGSNYPLHAPTGLAFDANGALLVADVGHHTVSRITTDGIATRLVGSVGTNGMLDATGTAALFDQPFGIAVGSGGNLYVTDSANAVVRRVTSSGTASLFAGSTDAPGNIDGTGTDARFAVPTGIAIDSSGSLFITDAFSDTIRQITTAAAVTTLAGSPTEYGSADGPGRTARFNFPNGVVVDGNSILVADTDNHTIRRITADGTTTTFAGAAGQVGSANGTTTHARFDHPQGLARDSLGNFYVADTGNHIIRRIATDGTVSTLAGTAGIAGRTDGAGPAARFNLPIGLTTDAAGNLYVADTGNSALRLVTTTGAVSTLTIISTPTVYPTLTPPATPQNSSGGGGGGGALSLWFAAALVLAFGLRLAPRGGTT